MIKIKETPLNFLWHLGEYRRAAILTPMFSALEAVMDILLPTIMAFIIDLGIEKGWTELRQYSLMDEIRNQLKTMNRQFDFYMKHKTAMKNNLISILDQTYPGANMTVTGGLKTYTLGSFISSVCIFVLALIGALDNLKFCFLRKEGHSPFLLVKQRYGKTPATYRIAPGYT